MKSHNKHHLSRIDQLPEAASDAVNRAIRALDTGKAHKEAIRQSLNVELEGLGIRPISKGSFSNFALKQAALRARHARALEASKLFAIDINGMEEANISAAIAAYLRDIIFELVCNIDVDQVDVDELQKITKAFNDSNLSESRSRDLSQREATRKKAGELAVKAVAGTGVPEETLKRVREAMGLL